MATFDRLAKFVIVILCVVFFGSVSACACSMAAALEPPRASVHPKMFILVGEVIGYTEPVTDPNNFRGTAVGLRMKIVEAIHVPYHRTGYVEVFMFRHDPDCFSVALEDKPTIGTRFRLALFPARLVSSYNGDGHVRLESRVFDRISVNESNFGFSTTTNSVFDYRTNIPVLIGSTSTTEMSDKRRWVDDFLYIESSKDLVRLARASDERERMDVLERLLYSPYVDLRQLVFSKYGISAQPEISFVRGLLSPGAAAALTKKELETTKKKLRRLTAKERKLLEERARLEEGWKGGLWK